jgi:hypothetical protein
VETVRWRSDTAGYQHDLLRYCEMGKNECFGRIEFAVGCDVTSSFKQAVDLGRQTRLANFPCQWYFFRRADGASVPLLFIARV